MDARTYNGLTKERALAALLRGDETECWRIQGWRFDGEEDLYEVRDVPGTSAYGGTVRTVVCRVCGGCRANNKNLDGAVQHHTLGCPTKAESERRYAERVERFRAKVAAIREGRSPLSSEGE